MADDRGVFPMLLDAMQRRGAAMFNPPKVGDDQLSVGFGGDVPVFPPLAILILIVVGLALRRVLGRVRIAPSLLKPVAVRMVILGVALAGFFSMIGLIKNELAKKDMNPDFSPVKGLVTTGVFSKSRNPLYAAGVLLLCPGIALAFDDQWMLVAMVGMPLYLGFVVIPAEEQLLGRLFPGDYAAYMEAVPRWGSPGSIFEL